MVTPSLRADAVPRRVRLPPAGVVALALPLVLLHAGYQPSLTVGVGSTSATATLSDLAVAVIAAAGLAAGVAHGFGPLARGLRLWIAGGLFLALVAAATFYPLLWSDGWPWQTHLVTAAKFAFYASIALAVPLVVRTRDDARILLGALVAWSAAATGFAVLQFLGLANDQFRGRIPGQRVSSFLGTHDFAALSAVALAVALAAIALGATGGRARVAVWVAAVSGVVGLVLAGAAAAVVGLVLAAAAAGLVARLRGTLTWRRAGGLAGVVAVVTLGVLALRAADVDQLLKFLGISPGKSQEALAGSSYSQRTVLAYVGARIYLDHPIAGVGWQGSQDDAGYRPYLADAKARFPNVEDAAFPSPEHRYGVQNLYVQTAADLGTIGLVVLAGLGAAGIGLAAAAALRAPPDAAPLALVPLLAALSIAGVWIGIGLVAGIPLDALTWLALGLAVSARGWSADGA